MSGLVQALLLVPIPDLDVAGLVKNLDRRLLAMLSWQALVARRLTRTAADTKRPSR